MQYDTGKYCVYYHRYHLVWSTKYRYEMLQGDVRRRVRAICKQVCREKGVDIIHRVLSKDHIHMFVSVPPKLAISDLVRLMKGRSAYKVLREFPFLKKRYWGGHFWGRGYFSTTNGAITEDIVLEYLNNHLSDATGASRQKFTQSIVLVIMDAIKDVRQICLRIEAIHFRRLDDGQCTRQRFRSTVSTRKQPVAASYRQFPFILPMSGKFRAFITVGTPILVRMSGYLSPVSAVMGVM